MSMSAEAWIPCTSPNSTCASAASERLHGALGVCAPATGACTCPEGYSGSDGWNVDNDCHVNETFHQFLHWLVFVVSFLGLVYCTYCLGLLLRRQRAEVRLAAASAQARRRSSALMMNESSAATRRQNARITLYYLEALALGTFWVNLYFLSPNPAKRTSLMANDAGQNLAMCITYIGLNCSLFQLTNLWIGNLPSLRHYRQFMKSKSPILHYPRVFRYVRRGLVIISWLLPIVLLLVLSHALPQYRELYLGILFVSIAVILTLYNLAMTFTCLLLLQMFQAMDPGASRVEDLTNPGVARVRAAFVRARVTIKFVIFTHFLGMPLGLPVLLMLGIDFNLREFTYFFLGLILTTAAICGPTLAHVILFRMEKPQASSATATPSTPGVLLNRNPSKESVMSNETLSPLKSRKVPDEVAVAVAPAIPEVEGS